jgi:hypothetical protein
MTDTPPPTGRPKNNVAKHASSQPGTRLTETAGEFEHSLRKQRFNHGSDIKLIDPRSTFP